MDIALIEDTHFLLQKAAIISHLTVELHGLGDKLKEMAQHSSLPAHLLKTPPKVSRGENYKGLPYLVLDYPRVFGQTDTFAFRVLFWWGHFVSANLYLSGSYLDRYLDRILLATSSTDPLFISTNASPWVHDLAEGHVELHSLSAGQIRQRVTEIGYLKLSTRLPLTDITRLSSFGKESFERFLTLLA